MATYKYSMRSLLFGNGISKRAAKKKEKDLDKKYNRMPGVAEIRKSGRVKGRKPESFKW